MTLVPCSACHRHVRVEASRCPFCSAPVPEALASRAIPAATQRLDRVAVFTFALALGGAACGEVVTDPSETAGSDGGGVTAIDAGSRDGGAGRPLDAAAPYDAGAYDGGSIFPMYGGAPSDAGGDAHVNDAGADGTVQDDGGIYVLYGLPPMDAAIGD